jgi:hypothetical protein
MPDVRKMTRAQKEKTLSCSCHRIPTEPSLVLILLPRTELSLGLAAACCAAALAIRAHPQTSNNIIHDGHVVTLLAPTSFVRLGTTLKASDRKPLHSGSPFFCGFFHRSSSAILRAFSGVFFFPARRCASGVTLPSSAEREPAPTLAPSRMLAAAQGLALEEDLRT